jgi:hypothetical protein
MRGAYSQDLRDRVIDMALGGLSARRRHGLGSDWRRRSAGFGRRAILGLVEAAPDMTISEILDKLAAERCLVSRATLWSFHDHCGLVGGRRT